MSGKTIDSNAMAGMFTEHRDRDRRQKRTIYAMLITLILCISCIGATACENSELTRALAYQTDKADTLTAQVGELQTVRIGLAEMLRAYAMEEQSRQYMDATVTAYTWTGNKTASGVWPKGGRTVAGPRWIPFGTKVYIDGFGWRIVEDRTHPRFDGRYDVYMGSKAECVIWGNQSRVVRVQ